MDGDSVHVTVVDEPDDLVGEELSVVLGRQVRLSGLGAVRERHVRGTRGDWGDLRKRDINIFFCPSGTSIGNSTGTFPSVSFVSFDL